MKQATLYILIILGLACNGPISASLKKKSNPLAPPEKIAKDETTRKTENVEPTESPKIVNRNNFIQEEILVAVNNHIITKKVFQQASEQQNASLYRQYSGKELDVKLAEARAKTLQGLIDAFLLEDKALDMGVSVSDEYINSTIDQIKKENKIASQEEFERAIKANLGIGIEDFKRNQKRQIIEQQVLGRDVFSKLAIEENELQAYYEQNLEEFKLPPRFKMRELIVSKSYTGAEGAALQKTVVEIQKKIAEGTSFESLIRQYSTSPSKELGGDIGWINKGLLRPSIEEAALGLEVGKVSSMIESVKDFAWVQLIAFEANPVQPFGEVKDKVLTKVQEPKAQNAIEQYLKNLRTRGNIRYLVPKDKLIEG